LSELYDREEYIIVAVNSYYRLYYKTIISFVLVKIGIQVIVE
jgi:hypothetical protein